MWHEIYAKHLVTPQLRYRSTSLQTKTKISISKTQQHWAFKTCHGHKSNHKSRGKAKPKQTLMLTANSIKLIFSWEQCDFQMQHCNIGFLDFWFGRVVCKLLSPFTCMNHKKYAFINPWICGARNGYQNAGTPEFSCSSTLVDLQTISGDDRLLPNAVPVQFSKKPGLRPLL